MESLIMAMENFAKELGLSENLVNKFKEIDGDIADLKLVDEKACYNLFAMTGYKNNKLFNNYIKQYEKQVVLGINSLDANHEFYDNPTSKNAMKEAKLGNKYNKKKIKIEETLLKVLDFCISELIDEETVNKIKSARDYHAKEIIKIKEFLDEYPVKASYELNLELIPAIKKVTLKV
jgi:hypothetical protein